MREHSGSGWRRDWRLAEVKARKLGSEEEVRSVFPRNNSACLSEEGVAEEVMCYVAGELWYPS